MRRQTTVHTHTSQSGPQTSDKSEDHAGPDFKSSKGHSALRASACFYALQSALHQHARGVLPPTRPTRPSISPIRGTRTFRLIRQSLHISRTLATRGPLPKGDGRAAFEANALDGRARSLRLRLKPPKSYEPGPACVLTFAFTPCSREAGEGRDIPGLTRPSCLAA